MHCNSKLLRNNSRHGLTLLELVIVMTILVALGGIAVAIAPDLLTKAHVSTCVNNIPALESAVQQRLLTEGSIGNRFDGIVPSDGNAPDWMPGVVEGNVEAYSLTQSDVDALAAIGVTEVVQPDDTAANATFGKHAGGTVVSLAEGVSLPQLSGDGVVAAETAFNFTAEGPLVILGVGEHCSLVGKNGVYSREAPIHFGDSSETRAENSYARYCILLQVIQDWNPGPDGVMGTPPGEGTEGADDFVDGSEVELVGAGAPHENGFEVVGTHLKEWYSADE